MNFPTQTGRFALGDLKLQSGEVLRDAALSWKSYGALSPARDNVILSLRWYSPTRPRTGRHSPTRTRRSG
jgi:homoserine O-acetyltransferase/O-succinyltransferase